MDIVKNYCWNKYPIDNVKYAFLPFYYVSKCFGISFFVLIIDKHNHQRSIKKYCDSFFNMTIVFFYFLLNMVLCYDIITANKYPLSPYAITDTGTYLLGIFLTFVASEFVLQFYVFRQKFYVAFNDIMSIDKLVRFFLWS